MATKRTPEEIKKIITEKVVGVIIPQHTAEGHFYKFPSGVVQPSVTTKLKVINKPHLLRWAIERAIEWLEVDNRWRFLAVNTMRKSYIDGAREAHTEIRDDAGSVGTRAHNAMEWFIKEWLETGLMPSDIREFFQKEIQVIDGQLIKADTADLRSVAAARGLEQLIYKHNIIPLASEILVGDEKFSAGTLDFLCLWDNRITLVDFKTSNQISQDYALQTAAYKFFFEKMTGVNISQIKIIHLSKNDDRYTVYNVVDPKGAYKAFRSVVGVYDWLEDGGDKLIKDIKRLKI